MTLGTKEWAAVNVNFSKGCSNGCLYCYARRIANRFGWKKDEEWTNMTNKPELAYRKFKKRQGWIMSPSSHDITEENIGLALKVFKNILDAKNKLLIVSKPNPDLVRALCEELHPWQNQILFRFTIGTLNDKIRQYWEPYAPSIEKRLQALKYSYNHKWNTSVSIEPFLDEKLINLIEVVSPYVKSTIWVGPMNKIHVPKDLWTEKLTGLYSSESLKKFKAKIERQNGAKICYKDHFFHIMSKSKKTST
ncbi:MAG: radical SAM protein [Candidatus Hermodarchaeota archaeon]